MAMQASIGAVLGAVARGNTLVKFIADTGQKQINKQLDPFQNIKDSLAKTPNIDTYRSDNNSTRPT